MIRLLIIDDSALMRRLISDVFAGEGDFELAAARSGAEGLALLATFKPDVVTLDVHMPGMDGLEVLDRLMLERPCPVLMVSSLTGDGAETTLRALELGAVDFVAKPGGAMSLKMDAFAPVLIAKVRQAAAARVRQSHRLAERLRAKGGAQRLPATGTAPAARRRPPAAVSAPFPERGERGLVIIGCSTGGPRALDVFLAGLPADFPWPVVVAQHMPASFTGPLARRLDDLCPLTVVEASMPMLLEAGFVFVARGDADAVIARRPGGLAVAPAPPGEVHRWRPSVDRLVDSAAALLPAGRVFGVLMTGMGNDGAASMTRLKAAGGWTAAESEQTAVIWGMPGELVKAGGACAIEPLENLAACLADAVREAA